MKLEKKTLSIINKYKTPCYIFDVKEIENQTGKIRNLFGEKYGLCFAVKANPFIVSMMNKFVDRFEACSHGEYKILKKNGIESDKIIYSGVNKSFDEIKALYDEGFRGICTIESLRQWKYIKELLTKNSMTMKLLLRLSSGNQFGVYEHELISIIKECKEIPKCKIYGIHFFSGTQKKNLKEIQKELTFIDDVCKNIFKIEGVQIKEIEYGAGLYANLFSEEEDSDYLSDVCEYINNILANYQVTIELGRYLTYTCGKYYSTVVDVKNTGTNNYAILDGGIHHINYYGQLLGIRVPVVKHFPAKELSDENKEYIICGSLCSVNDILLKKWNGTVNVGDIFEFHKAGAYSCTEGSSLFLSRDLPAIIAVSDDDVELLRGHDFTYPLNCGSKGKQLY